LGIRNRRKFEFGGGIFMKKTTAVKIFLTLITALSLLSVFVSLWIFALATGVCILGWVTLWKRSRES
jgi:hypothetical protein